MNTKRIEMISNGLEMGTTENDGSIKQEDEMEMASKTEERNIKRKITKQSDVDEKDQSNESFDKMKLIKENLTLLSEIDKLKKSNRSMSQRIYYLETIVKVPLKKLP